MVVMQRNRHATFAGAFFLLITQFGSIAADDFRHITFGSG
jgi:hypothetical protein